MKPIPLTNRGELCCPCEPDRVPRVDLEFSAGDEPELPEEGTITFRYKLRCEVEDYEGESIRYELKLSEILNFKATVKDSNPESGEDALDRLAEEATKDEESE